jgi:hypothetical protein
LVALPGLPASTRGENKAPGRHFSTVYSVGNGVIEARTIHCFPRCFFVKIPWSWEDEVGAWSVAVTGRAMALKAILEIKRAAALEIADQTPGERSLMIVGRRGDGAHRGHIGAHETHSDMVDYCDNLFFAQLRAKSRHRCSRASMHHRFDHAFAS